MPEPTTDVRKFVAAAIREGQARATSANLNPPADQPEADFQRDVIEYARSLGYKVAHFRKVRVQRTDGSVYWETPVAAEGKGFPDLLIVGHGRVLFRELKASDGRLTDAQKAWGVLLDDCGNYRVWRPEDWSRIRTDLAPLQSETSTRVIDIDPEAL